MMMTTTTTATNTRLIALSSFLLRFKIRSSLSKPYALAFKHSENEGGGAICSARRCIEPHHFLTVENRLERSGVQGHPMAEKRLAIEGGKPVRVDPWPTRDLYDDSEISSVVRLLENSRREPHRLWRREGRKAAEFEEAFAAYTGCRFATASSSGTAAVHLALAACEFEPNSEVIVSPITDVGSVTPILYENLVPVFADVDPSSLNMDPSSIASRVSRKTKAIVLVHLGGYVCDMDPIMKIARERGIVVIEDCAQTLGASYHSRMAGTIGQFGTFSFMGIKHIVTGGEGGMTVTSDEDSWRKMMIFSRNMLTPGADFLYDVPFKVLNYRMTEIQAALGVEQLKKVDSILERRRVLFRTLAGSIKHLKSIKMAEPLEGTVASPWYPIFTLNLEMLTVDSKAYAESLRAEGIPCAAGYIQIPIYQYHFMRKYAIRDNPNHIEYEHCCPVAEESLNRILRLWGGDLHESCTEREVHDIVAAFEKLEDRYSK